MAATGIILIFLGVLRVWFDGHGWPATPNAQVRWGAIILFGSALVAISIVVTLWRYAP